jgi:ABC-type amino acid transport substrate-binding protein
VRRWWWPVGLAVLVVGAAVLFIDRDEALRLFPSRDWTWQAMQGRDTWRVGLDPSFPPFEHLDEAGQPVGFDVDLARYLAAAWNMEVELVAIGFDSLYDAVRTGQVDSVVSAYPYDPRLTRDVRFSTPYFDAGIRLAVRIDSPLQEVADLAGQTVAVEWGSMSDMVGRRLQREQPAIHLAQYDTPAESLQALLADPTIAAALVDNVTLRQAEVSGLPLKGVGPVLESNPYVIMMPRTGRQLQEQVEAALQTLRELGELDVLEQTWFAVAQ